MKTAFYIDTLNFTINTKKLLDLHDGVDARSLDVFAQSGPDWESRQLCGQYILELNRQE